MNWNKLTWSLLHSFLCLCEIPADFGEFHPGAKERKKEREGAVNDRLWLRGSTISWNIASIHILPPPGALSIFSCQANGNSAFLKLWASAESPKPFSKRSLHECLEKVFEDRLLQFPIRQDTGYIAIKNILIYLRNSVKSNRLDTCAWISDIFILELFWLVDGKAKYSAPWAGVECDKFSFRALVRFKFASPTQVFRRATVSVGHIFSGPAWIASFWEGFGGFCAGPQLKESLDFRLPGTKR